MKISYDAEIDALYIRLIEGKHACRTVRLSEEVALNIGDEEKLVGIEVLDATELLGFGKDPAIVLEGMKALASPLSIHANLTKHGKENLRTNSGRA